jgi:hypothetical protein
MDEYDKSRTNKEVEASKIEELAFPSLEPPVQPPSKMRSNIQPLKFSWCSMRIGVLSSFKFCIFCELKHPFVCLLGISLITF